MTRVYQLTQFAVAGDRTAIPFPAEGDGTISYTDGYGPQYSLDQITEPTALDIERREYNELMFGFSGSIKEIQEQGVPEFITTAENGGVPFSYKINAVVRYLDQLYFSLVGNNTELPTNPANWRNFQAIAEELAPGIIALATNVEAAARTVTNKALVPSNIPAFLENLTPLDTGTNITSGTLDDQTSPGFFMVSGATVTNVPVAGVINWALTVHQPDSDTASQTMYQGDTNDVWVRLGTDLTTIPVWSTWVNTALPGIVSDAVSTTLTLDASQNATFAGDVIGLGVFRGANGTNQAPQYSFTQDLNTGMYRVAQDTLGFATHGTLALSLDPSQNATFAGDVTLSGHILNSAPAGELQIFGSNSVGSGGGLILRGSTHPTQANDVLIQSGTSTAAQYDSSASVWDFQGNDLTGVGDVTMNGNDFVRSVGNNTLTISGGTSAVLGGNIIMYGESRPSLAGDIAFRTDGTDRLRWDNSASAWNFGTNLLTGVSDIGRGATTGQLHISGGSTLNQGGNTVYFAETHATNANDIQFRANTSVILNWDDSASNWDFQGNALSGVADIDADGYLGNSGSATTPTFTFTADTNTGLYRLAADNIGFTANGQRRAVIGNATGVTGNSGMWIGNGATVTLAVGANTSGVITDLTDATSKSGRIGTPHYTNAEQPMAIIFANSTATENLLNIGGNTGLMNAATEMRFFTAANNTTVTGVLRGTIGSDGTWNFNGNTLEAAPVIQRGVGTGTQSISGGSAGSSGANILLSGETHATIANDINFRVGATSRLLWDDSASTWDFQGNDITTTGDITANGFFGVGDEVQLTIATAAITAASSNLTIVPENGAGNTDTLSTINGGKTGDIVVLRADVTGDTITVDNVGNIRLVGGTFAMSTADKSITLKKRANGNWNEQARADI